MQNLTKKSENYRYKRVVGAVIFLLIFTDGYSQRTIIDSFSNKASDTLNYVPDIRKSFNLDSTIIPGHDFKRSDSIIVSNAKTEIKRDFKLHKSKPLFKSNGHVTIENHYTNLQSPYVRSATAYTRLSYQGNIFLAGLPFQGSAFLTTENNTVYRSNFINLRFDGNQYRRTLKQDAENQAKILDKSVRFNSFILEELKGQLENIEDQIKGNDFLIKQRLDDSLAKLNKPRNPLDTIDIKSRIHVDTLSDTLTDKPSEWKTNAQSRKDSLMVLKDSLSIKFTRIYKVYREDSLKVAEYKSLIEHGPESILQDSMASQTSKYTAWVSRVKNFQLGQAMVNYNELSLYGHCVKGLDMSMDLNGWQTGITLGRAFNNEGMFDPIAKPEFNKNLAGIQLGRTNEKGDKLILSYFYSKDIKSVKDNVKNQVLTLDVQKTYNRLTIQLTAGNSNYQQLSPITIGEAAPNQASDKENKAIKSKATVDLDYGAKVSLKYNYIGALYTTIGNPFLRKNYLEKEYDWEQKWAKGKISSKVLYKKLQTLKSELSPEVNTTRGAGVQVQSAFSKGINFFALYSPYELGNNHPDTAFRTFNRTSLISAGISYSKLWKRAMWLSQFILSNSSISGENLPSTQTTQYTLENTLSIDGSHDIRIEASINRTRPNLDSMNFSSLSGQYMKVVKQNLSLGGNFKSIKFSESSHLYGAGINCQWVLLEKVRITSDIELSEVQNWWGVEGRKLVTTANLRVGYSW